ncbi:hypothetical protein E1A91_A11G324000v1 [Gossypium mustelinum]|uniref:Uncharacterized protein n=1 Tax=Gossypium mustelinum TaxID=34275 RepID=A0A5D2XEB1_GOSMU|nr:hypothetical protein E1A91_A11G324000v1 [Gossypium mustelinum]
MITIKRLQDMELEGWEVSGLLIHFCLLKHKIADKETSLTFVPT